MPLNTNRGRETQVPFCRLSLRRFITLWCVGGLFLCMALRGFAASMPGIAVDVPPDSPVLIVSTDVAAAGPGTGGAATATSLHVTLRNVSTKKIASIVFRVRSNGAWPQGEEALALPSVQAAPGSVVPVRLDVQLPRESGSSRSGVPALRLTLDAVLFADFSFYGPDFLHNRRRLTVFECQAQQEDSYLRQLFAGSKLPDIREELNFGLPDDQPQFAMELTSLQIPAEGGKPLTINPIVLKQSPVHVVNGGVLLGDRALFGLHVVLQNVSRKPVRSLDVAFILRDERGHETRIAAMPSQFTLRPSQTHVVQQQANLLFARAGGQAVMVRSIQAYVSDVEFQDGSIWVPSRPDINEATDSPVLRRALAECPETERLSGIFRREGIAGVESELGVTAQ